MNDLAKEYAFALFSLAKKKNTLSETAESLETIEEVLRDNPSYPRVLLSPAIAMEERLSLLDAAFGSIHEDVLSFLKLLCEKGHAARIEDCIQAFFLLQKEAQGKIPVLVTSAFPLDESQKEVLKKKLSHLTGKEPEITYLQEPELIGGIRIQIEDRVLDGTLSGKLSLMKGVLNREQPC